MSHSKSSGILGCSSLWKVYWRIAPHQPTQWAQTASLAHIPPGAWFFKLWERGENHEDFTPPKNSTILSSPQDLMFFLSFQKRYAKNEAYDIEKKEHIHINIFIQNYHTNQRTSDSHRGEFLSYSNTEMVLKSWVPSSSLPLPNLRETETRNKQMTLSHWRILHIESTGSGI